MRSFNWKKMLIPAVMVALITALTGCGAELTDEQNRMIAEYAADLLLKYDKNYQERYHAEESKPEDITEEVLEDASEESGTEEVTEEGTEASEDAAENTAQDGLAEEDAVMEDNGSETDIAAIVGIPEVSITYQDCMFLDRYPSLDSDGSFVYLEADEGYKLAVIRFDITNPSAQAVTVDLLNTDISYQLIMNDSNAAKPMLTILMDDLGTFQSTVPANSEQSAVLIFQMSDSSVEQIERLDIKAVYQGEEHVIHIQ